MENNDRTIEEMQAQIAVLKRKIERESIVNEKMVRNAVRKDYSVIRRHVIVEIFSSTFVILMAWTYFPLLMGFSYWFSVATTLMMLMAVAYTIWMTRNVKMSNVMTLNLASAARVLKRLKRDYNRWFIVAVPVLIGWLAWFSYEIYRVCEDLKMFLATMSGMGIGLLVGGFIAWRMRKALFSACDDVIMQTEGVD